MNSIKPTVTDDEAALMDTIDDAITSTMAAEIALLKHGRVERTFTVSLANQIATRIKRKDILVDAFYNKHLGATKKLGGHPIELDIAVHQRNSDNNNLVAIELETNNRPARDDVWKIKGLTHDLGGYGYKLGLYVVFGILEKAGCPIFVEWYKKGRVIYSRKG